MFGRATRCLAIAALATHLWVSMVVAPWHHLVAHRLPAVAATHDDGKVPVRQCSCRHHQHPVCDPKTGTKKPVPHAPAQHDDDCLVCQVMAQAATASEVVTLEPSLERIEFSPPVSAVQPLLGASIDPVSRGPPAV